ncbi:MAG: TldD/PmbA family protein [Bacillota bacterium]
MEYNKFKKKIFEQAKAVGFSEAELYRNRNSSIDLRVFKGEVDHYSLNDDDGIGFRGIYQGKMGFSYTENISETEIDFLVNKAKENAEIVDKKEGIIFSEQAEYKELKIDSDDFGEISPDEKIELLKKAEKAAYDYDDRIEVVNYCMYSDMMLEEVMDNTAELELSNNSQLAYIFLSVVAADEDDKKSSGKVVVKRKSADFNPVELAEDVAEEAVSLLGASSIASGDYPVLLRNEVAGDLLQTFASTLSAENVQKGLSLFEGKLEDMVAVADLTLIDDPFLEEGFRSTPFDSEGYPTRKKEIIKDGVLTTYLYNLKTAARDGVKSTGNAFRSSHKSSVGIAPTNLYIEPGKISFNQLKKMKERTLLITDITGLHAGANQVSGDFSLSAEGFLLENGEIVKPVEQITVSGNFIELLKDVIGIGNDLEMGSPGRGHIGSPSLLIESLSVGGN